MKLSKETRRNIVLEAALAVALRDGLVSITFQNIAAACEVDTSAATVRRYGGRITDLQIAVVERAALAASNAEHKRLRDDAIRFGLIADNAA